MVQTFAIPSMRPQPPPGSVDAKMAARTLVKAFCESPSYDSTRRRFPVLGHVPVELWTYEMLDELDAAAEFNRQINEAVLVDSRVPAPEAVRDLIKRVKAEHRS